jgi:MFS family permease
MSSQSSRPYRPIVAFHWIASRFFSAFAKQMIRLVVAWHVYEISKDPLLLGLIGLAEGLPYVGISLWAGQMVDRREKRAVMMVAQAGNLVTAAALFAVVTWAPRALAPVYAVMSVLGFLSAFELASSSAYAGSVVPTERYSRIAAWNLAFFQAATIAGPLAAGAIVSRSHNSAAIGGAAVLWIVAVTFSTRLVSVTPHPSDESESALDRIRSGLRFIRSERLIYGAMMLDMVAVLFGDCVAIFPIFAERYGAGALGLGLLRASPAIGSTLMSMIHVYSSAVKPTWQTLRWAILVFGCSMLAFALSPWIGLAIFFLAVGGMADGVSVIVRQSLYQRLTPDPLRGRVAAVSGVFISTSNEIGAFESGVAARLLGAVGSVLFGGTVTLISAAVASRFFRDLGRREEKAAPSA